MLTNHREYRAANLALSGIFYIWRHRQPDIGTQNIDALLATKGPVLGKRGQRVDPAESDGRGFLVAEKNNSLMESFVQAAIHLPLFGAVSAPMLSLVPKMFSLRRKLLSEAHDESTRPADPSGNS
ncbi:hypothetical protein GAR06_06254 [Micromonospora saelicesensis]|nr:hypothetical protein GAR06_06254 [Micromonospora saelicesensis]